MSDRQPSPRYVAAAGLFLFLLASFFRLYQLDSIPHGLFIDEAQNGLDALSIREGAGLPVFVEAGSAKARGREPMLHYLMAGVFRLRGPSVESIRLTVAMIGIATVVLFFIGSKRLFGLRAAFVSGALLAVGRWHVTMSRVGVRAVLTPLWIILVLLALHNLARRRTSIAAFLLGAALGAGFYTYPAFWIVPGALAVALLSMLVFGGRSWRCSDLRLAVVALISFLAVTAPLIRYAVTKPDHFFARTSDLSAPLRAGEDRFAMLLDHLQRGMFMLHLRGDESPMYNIPGRPFLDPVTGLAFLVGLFVVLKQLPRQPILYGALLWFWLLPLLPGAMTATGAWGGMRSIGSVPAVFLIAGIGLSRLTQKPVPWLATPPWVAASLLAVVLSIIGTLNYRDYFGTWANDPGVQGSYQADVVRFFDFCAELSDENDVYLSPYVYTSPNFRFLAVEHSVDLKRIDDLNDFLASGGDRSSRVFVSDYAPVTEFIRRIYPNHEEIARYSVWGRSRGVVLRVRGDQLETSLPEEQRAEAEYRIRSMWTELEAATRDW